MNWFVRSLDEITHDDLALVGGKAMNLAEVARVDGVRVPPGFCITTNAFDLFMSAVRSAGRAPAATAIPHEIVAEITRAVAAMGSHLAYAVRSSATAEDQPSASFAGQHDSYLDVTGVDAIVESVRSCWLSLFSERAVAYRDQHGIDHDAVRMAVIVQRMASPSASGVLFTADPLTGHRGIATVESSRGLGEALVSGLVTPDRFVVRDDAIVSRSIVGPAPTLTDTEALRLVQLGRRIARHFGRPQDIEWCLENDDFQVVQSRPITTLFPPPETDDGKHHVYISVGHNQMMTDAMKPLGLSIWQLTTARPMSEAGGRLFVDVTPILASPAAREGFLAMIARTEPLTRDALQTVLERNDFLDVASRDDASARFPGNASASVPTDPAIVTRLIERNEASVAALASQITGLSGTALLDFILEDIKELKRLLFDSESHQAIMAGMEAMWWLNDHLLEWLGEKGAADSLTQSVSNNITSEMGLALLDVADVVRLSPAVVSFLRGGPDDQFIDELPHLPGGTDARDAIRGWLRKYGMRGGGEIDITRPRWAERPTMLLPLLLSHVDNFPPEESARRFLEGQREAAAKEQDLLSRLSALPDGARKVDETKQMIDRLRTFAGYREYPKYGKIARELFYKRAIMQEADRLAGAGVLVESEDVFYLRFEELREALRNGHADQQLIASRKEAFRAFEKLTPPRVITSDGEIISGKYRRSDAPPGSLIGLPVSAGSVEGRARVILDIANATLEPGDILVTAYTDPSWTPLFIGIRGLVTEVGGLMTHGAVIAREYGLPAVVGVENATRLIKDGRRIRVHGTEGFVELLDQGEDGSR